MIGIRMKGSRRILRLPLYSGTSAFRVNRCAVILEQKKGIRFVCIETKFEKNIDNMLSL